ncbi:YbaK/EbsC family protein [Brevibacillus centrosporus]|uniref:YbaK/EbsC family protein n=1 Tax=Brevibacillus centrosporus TaxID=54910 RepID=UPI000F09A57B|nr:YbaK/EbsC family protein [Brevibacillus centrosporus]MEC2132087.1 YbaK/EbsC family protein [Brevibacillus centrosporus]MED4911965.1 YbaK/EbsC family protein [Brevibacillus centrosporus]RNB68680.1 YbaK/EbsC family protein [Brevibacillus centrosporus]GED31719.1 cys-tRNA(pro)/cys-tRNA(cys) deacylase [Brevibacillus centrosporus]
MSQGMKESAQRVQNVLRELGYTNEVVELPDSTRTAQEAASAIECEIAQIAKSILFRLKKSERPLLVVASGVNRVNEKLISTYVEDELGKADANFVRERTGFVIGGVAPVGHTGAIETIVDEDLFRYQTIWAAAGHPKAVFQLTPDELLKMTGGRVLPIK